MAPSKKGGGNKKGGNNARDDDKKAIQKTTSTSDPLFPSRPRNFNIGGDIRPPKDLSRFVRWPKYIRLQRQRSILYQRLKVPPSIYQFTKTLNKNEAMTVFNLCNKYRPETPTAKKQRLQKKAASAAAATTKTDNKSTESDDEEMKDNDDDESPNVVKFGLNHVTTLIEEKEASLVLIANDVDPIEMVLWLPALCRKMDVPFMIVKDRARLGAVVHMKTSAVLCFTSVERGADSTQLELLQNVAREKYNENADLIRKWGGGVMGLKTQAKLDKRAKAIAAEEAKKMATLGRK